MEQIDWSKAPEGATHFSRGNSSGDTLSAWWRPSHRDHGKYECWALGLSFGCEFWQDGTFGLPTNAVKREWTGPEDGLPPVGMTIEVAFGVETNWRKVLIVGTHGTMRVFHILESKIDEPEYAAWGNRFDFRPIRTPEQIAAEQREKDIEELRVLLSNVACDDYHAAVAMIDAGYRLQTASK